MDRLTALQVFRDVADTGSFTATADRLGLSRPMVSRHITVLEEWLGARLLQRTTRRVALTDAGAQALRRAEQMLTLAEDTEAEVARDGGDLRGRLRMAASASFAAAQLAAPLTRFLAQHPGVSLQVQADDSVVNLLAQRIDLAIRISSAPDPALIGRPLAPCDSALVASPDYLRRRGVPTEPGDLPQHEVMAHDRVGRQRWQLTRAADGQVAEFDVVARLCVNDANVLLPAALGGGGIVMLPTYQVQPLLASGELVQVLPDWWPPVMTVYALYPSRRLLPPAVRALLDHLADHFAQPGWMAAGAGR